MAQTTKIPEHECAKLECPFCNREMTPEQYEKARKANELKMNQQVAEEIKRHDEEMRIRSEEEKKVHQKEKEETDKMYQESLDRIKEQRDKIHAEEVASIVETNEKEITLLKDAQATVAQEAFNQANTINQSEIAEKDLKLREQEIMMDGMRNKLDETTKKLEQRQPNITGRAGEFNLEEKLREAFPEDDFIPQTTGTEEADLVQVIKVNDEPLETPICHDNKEAKSVGKKEREKAKNYRKIHNTNHIVITTRNIPNEVENGMLGRVDGVLHAHPDVIVEVVREIRSNIIQSHMDRESQDDRDSKEATLYDYITSQEYLRQLERVREVREKIDAMQIKQEAGHKKMWKERKDLSEHLSDIYTEISSEVKSITQSTPAAKPRKPKKTSKSNKPKKSKR